MDLNALLGRLDIDADWVGLRYVDERKTLRWVRDGQPQLNQLDRSRGIMVEVLAAGQFAYAATSRLDIRSLQQAAQKAVDLARAASPHAVCHFTSDVRPAVTGRYVSPYQKPADAMSAGELNHLLIKSCENLRVSDKVVASHAMLRMINSEHRFVSSNGSDIEQRFMIMSTASQAM